MPMFWWDIINPTCNLATGIVHFVCSWRICAMSLLVISEPMQHKGVADVQMLIQLSDWPTMDYMRSKEHQVQQPTTDVLFVKRYIEEPSYPIKMQVTKTCQKGQRQFSGATIAAFTCVLVNQNWTAGIQKSCTGDKHGLEGCMCPHTPYIYYNVHIFIHISCVTIEYQNKVQFGINRLVNLGWGSYAP